MMTLDFHKITGIRVSETKTLPCSGTAYRELEIRAQGHEGKSEDYRIVLFADTFQQLTIQEGT